METITLITSDDIKIVVEQKDSQHSTLLRDMSEMCVGYAEVPVPFSAHNINLVINYCKQMSTETKPVSNLYRSNLARVTPFERVNYFGLPAKEVYDLRAAADFLDIPTLYWLLSKRLNSDGQGIILAGTMKDLEKYLQELGKNANEVEDSIKAAKYKWEKYGGEDNWKAFELRK